MNVNLTRRSFIAAGGALVAVPLLAAPQPPRLRRLSPKLDRIVAGDVTIETIATGIAWAEGPVWIRNGGYLLFSDPPANVMRRWSRQDGLSRFLEPSGVAGLDPKLVREAGSNGLGVDHQGGLLIANSGGRSIDRLDLRTKQRTVLVDRYNGKRFSSCNDLTVSRSGAIYFTDPPYGFSQGDASPLKEASQNGVYRWSPKSGTALITGILKRPNGIALSSDEKRLFVSSSDEADRRIIVIDLGPNGLPKGEPKTFLEASSLPPGPGNPDGMKIAPDGTMFCTGPGGLWILAPDGEKLGLIEQGASIANCCFGEDGKTLFMTGADRVLRMPIKINGFRT